MTLIVQEVADHVGERIMCPHLYAMERAAFYEAQGRLKRGCSASVMRAAIQQARAAGNPVVLPPMVDPYAWHSAGDLIDGCITPMGGV